MVTGIGFVGNASKDDSKRQFCRPIADGRPFLGTGHTSASIPVLQHDCNRYQSAESKQARKQARKQLDKRFMAMLASRLSETFATIGEMRFRSQNRRGGGFLMNVRTLGWVFLVTSVLLLTGLAAFGQTFGSIGGEARDASRAVLAA